MADDQDKASKTEEATPKKLEEAHQKGQIAKSQEVNNWIMITAGTIFVAIFGADVVSGVKLEILPFIESPHDIAIDPGKMGVLLSNVSGAMFALLAGPFTLLIIAAILGNVVQSKPVFTFEKLKPDLSKFSIIKGAKKMFSPSSVVELAKGFIKVGIVFVVVAALIWPERQILTQLMTTDTAELLLILERLILLMLAGVIASMGVIAALDFMYQKQKHAKELRMTRTDVKDETKQSEGDPLVRARIRAIRQDRARQRMMAAVPGADVVITNPTHYAVALKYESEVMAAPTVVAKGVDDVAQRIRDLAEEHAIPIIANPHMARVLHASVEVGREIPVEHYKAVAEIIGYVMGLKDRGANRGTVH